MNQGIPSHSSISHYSTYIIRDPATHLVITLKKGTTIDGADSPHGHNRGTHWHCVENKNRWLGFYNAVSGTYIRHNNQKKEWRFDANGKKHGDWESFCARECPGGGHVLLVKHWDGLLAMRAEGGELVVDCKGEGGTAWEFVRVG
ncbi:hypothetical protein BO71DRAFT_422338 [Aspergillus ellipticus CBS 707.79]|uniref:Ricin B lectin domain-containing protein n=1 Tax=Aspergillus ellipticus CBS 707.79 TaxID=1448320 RepID=A0A319CYP3_9EURO|nr:hypothetical protein BO71DRAFT_422338 [Aspergillus ellipticus CBS 707.79]